MLSTSKKFNITYVLDWKDGPESGVAKKVISQIDAWGNCGIQVKLIVLTTESNSGAWNDVNQVAEVFSYSNYFVRARLRTNIFAGINKNKDLLYCRFGFFLPSQLWYLRKIKFFTEVNTLDSEETKHRSILLKIYRRITDSFVLKKSIVNFCVTNEIVQQLESRISKSNFILIPNSINLEKFRTLPPAGKNKLRIAFVGSNNQVWHGVDRIFNLARYLPEIQFIVIGNNSYASDLRNIEFKNALYGTDLLKELKLCTVAISSLSLDANKMKQACPLKSREYLALGLPVIAGYQDVSFPNGANFILQLYFSPNPNWNKLAESVENFAKFWQNRRVSHSDLKSINQQIVERPRIQMISKVILGNFR